VIGRVGRFVEPAIRPLGFDWRIGTALIGATAAKEVFVSQLSIVYATGSGDNADMLREKLRANYTPLVGFCIMLFSLISTPCMATVAMTRQETNSWGWAVFQFVGLTVLAYVITLTVFQVGRLL
jgi:ferrous iron transport protein B